MRRKKLTAALLGTTLALSLLGSGMKPVLAAGNAAKDETVYVSQDSDGNITEINVTDVLSDIGSGEIKDISILEEIENTKGSETFSREDGNCLLWQAKNKDITYQGTTDKKLPVGVSVSYKLDGNPVSAMELAGKSGKVEITLQYKNTSTYHDVINNEDILMTTPFFMLSAIVMDQKIFSNITVSQGKIVSEGDTQIAIAYSMPGFSDALKLTGDMKESIDEKLSDTVTITADAANFELDSIYTIATADLLSETTSDSEDKADDTFEDLETALDDMIDASDTLISGSSDLTGGLHTLADGFDAFSDGISGLKDGAKALADGTKQFSAGMKTYTDGVKTLQDGTNQYVAGTNGLADSVLSYIAGEQQIAAGVSALYKSITNFPSLYTAFSGSFTAYIDSVNTLLNKDTINALSSASNTLADSAAKEESMLQALDAGYNSAYSTLSDLADAISSSDLTDEQKASYNQALASLYALTNDTANNQTPSLKKATNTASDMKSGANTLSDAVSAFEQNRTAIYAGGEDLKNTNASIAASITGTVSGIKSVNDSLTTLSSYNEDLSKGAGTLKKSGTTLKNSIKELHKNAKKFKTSSSQLLQGAVSLSDGVNTLNKKAPEVKKGISALASGSAALTGGLRTFKKEGTQKMKDTYEDEIQTVIHRFRSITGENAGYDNFTGISDDMKGSVKFIFQTQKIQANAE